MSDILLWEPAADLLGSYGDWGLPTQTAEEEFESREDANPDWGGKLALPGSLVAWLVHQRPGS